MFEDYEGVEFHALTGEAPEEFYTAMEGAIQADPDMLGAWGLFSSATYGMMQAIEASGQDILLSSVDNDRVILEGIYNGTVLGSTGYSAIEGSRLALMQMVNILNGEEVPGIIYQTNTFITKDNVEEMFEESCAGDLLWLILWQGTDLRVQKNDSAAEMFPRREEMSILGRRRPVSSRL